MFHPCGFTIAQLGTLPRALLLHPPECWVCSRLVGASSPSPGESCFTASLLNSSQNVALLSSPQTPWQRQGCVVLWLLPCVLTHAASLFALPPHFCFHLSPLSCAFGCEHFGAQILFWLCTGLWWFQALGSHAQGFLLFVALSYAQAPGMMNYVWISAFLNEAVWPSCKLELEHVIGIRRQCRNWGQKKWRVTTVLFKNNNKKRWLKFTQFERAPSWDLGIPGFGKAFLWIEIPQFRVLMWVAKWVFSAPI